MSRELHLQGLGVGVTLRLLDGADAQADADLWRQITEAWSRCRVDEPPTKCLPFDVQLSALDGDERDDLLQNGTPDRLMTELTQKITRLFIQQQIGQLLMLHAGGVTHPATGDAIAFVAAGGTGKSTLTRALAQTRGYGYISDETIGVRPDGRILPYPKPISVRVRPGVKDEMGPDSLQLTALDAPPRLRHVVLLRRDADAPEPVVEPLDLFDAIEELLPETSSLGELPQALPLLSDLLDSTGGAQRWTYAEHPDLFPLVAERIGRP